MRLLTLALTLLFVHAAVATAQTTQTVEQQIRALIAKYDAGQTQGMFSADRIVWTGAMKRPATGSEPHEQVPGERQISNRVPGSQRSKTTGVRVEDAARRRRPTRQRVLRTRPTPTRSSTGRSTA